MSIRLRLILLILAVGFIPSLVTVFWATYYVRELTVQGLQTAVEETARDSVHNKAYVTAQQIKSYLRFHTEVDLSNKASWGTDRGLAMLAVQTFGRTGHTFVFNNRGAIYFHINPAMVGKNLRATTSTQPELLGIVRAALDGSPSEGFYTWTDTDGTVRREFVAIEPVEGTILRVAATASVEEFSQPVQTLIVRLGQVTDLARRRLVVVVLVISAVALVAGGIASLSIAAPLRNMAAAATRVIAGDWEAIRPLPRRDELGTLSSALYTMTARLRELIVGLEQQVAERTASLERRARYLEATAEVARAATAVLDLQELLSRVASLVSEHFGFYHAGIFMLDPTGEWAELRAASSEGGQRMLARKHRLRAGREGIVGYVIGRGEPRIALDVGKDAVFFDNPDLPETRSEMALPLRVRGETIGVLDVQSKEPAAFTDEDVAVLQTLADQVATAIHNAQLFEQLQASLEAERRAYGELSRKAWGELLRARTGPGFSRDRRGLFPTGEQWSREMELALRDGRTVVAGDAPTLAVPIRVRDRVVGVLEARRAAGEAGWPPEQVALMEALADRLGEALESARIHQEAQRRAVRERLTREITERMRRATSVEGIIQTAVDELFGLLGTSRTFVRLGIPAEQETEQSGDGRVKNQ